MRNQIVNHALYLIGVIVPHALPSLFNAVMRYASLKENLMNRCLTVDGKETTTNLKLSQTQVRIHNAVVSLNVLVINDVIQIL